MTPDSEIEDVSHFQRLAPLIYFGRVFFCQDDEGEQLRDAAKYGGLRSCYGLWSQLEGTSVLQRAARRCTLRPGQVAVTDPGWSLRLAPDSRLAYVAFDLLPRDDSRRLDRREVPPGPPQPAFSTLIGYQPGPLLDAADASAGAALADILISRYWVDEQSSWVCTARLHQWMVDLLGRWRWAGCERASSAGDRDLVGQAEDFLRARARHGVTVAQAARACGLSRDGLTTLFKRHHGYGPGRFIDRLQLDHACRLLRETDLPMDAVAHGSGFRSESTLFRRFRSVLGMTPRQWRQLQRLMSAAR